MSESTADYFLIASIFLATVGVTVSDVSAQEPTRERPESQYRMEVSPRRAPNYQPVQITIRGLEPGEEVTLRGKLYDYGGADWQASATFRADSQGIVDLSELAPIAGSYDSVDPMGLFWSMTRVERDEPDEERTPQFAGGVQPGEPLLVTLSAEAESRPTLSDTLERLFADSDVARRPVHEEGLVGTLFVPSGSAPRPALLVPNGGFCAPPERFAASLAAHGFVTLALQWCGAEGLPESTRSETPLEYFETAINWLQRQEEVADDRVGVIGMSTGGVVALVLGSRFPDIRAVVSIKSSGLNGFQFTYRGEPIPRLPRMPLTETLGAAVISEQPAECRPGGAEEGWSCYDQTSLFLTRLVFHGFVNPGSLEQGVIPVERINGPVLLISGVGDLALPSTLLSEVAYRRLEMHQFAFPYEHLAYPGAGHRLGAPNLPRTDDRFGSLLLGGNPKDAAAANVAYWPRMVEFLREHLGTGARD